MIRDDIRKLISGVAEKKFGDMSVPDFSVAPPEQAIHGDYATNIAMALAKIAKKSPMEIAREIAEDLQKEIYFKKVECVAPGFINIWLSDEVLVSAMNPILKNPSEWGKSNVGEGKTIMVEYFQLNIAKRPHIGHLRSAVIGDALKRIFLSQGYHAVSDTHVGDWGTQFGILLLEYKTSQQSDVVDGDPFEVFESLYQKGVARTESDPEVRDRAKEEFAKLERGDPENRKIWEWIVDVSMKKLFDSAHRLGLLEFDEHKGESMYEEAMAQIVELALQKNIAKKNEDGSVIVDLTAEKLDEAVLIKSDGASTYLLRDLATIQYRKEHWNFFKNLYVIDVRQSHHFQQVFRVAELLGFEGVGESEHISFGFMSLPEGAISTRKGNTISLDAVLDEAEKKAVAVIAEKNPDLRNAQEVARMVGIGALKYFDLSHNRKSDIVFEWDRALAFEGNTGPYLQYTHARLKSILRKIAGTDDATAGSDLDVLEHHIVAMLLRFPEILEDVLKEQYPNLLTNYLSQLAQLINEFYHSHPVTQEADQQKRSTRAALVSAAATTLKNGLGFLGIEAPEEM